jgi:branched-chain amino acid transport system ATP-binding protein
VRVEIGSVCALIGPNGAGKTTLFNCVSGLTRPQGRILFDGQEITGLPSHARAGMGIARTFQTPALVDESSVLENVLLGDYCHARRKQLSLVNPLRARQGKRRIESEADELLAVFGLSAEREREVGDLPHGQRRRVEIVRGLLEQPRLLLLDEPAAGLGPEESLPLFAEVTAWAKARRTTILLIEHSMELVMQVATEVIVMNAGSVLTSGSPEEVRNDARVIEAYLGG